MAAVLSEAALKLPKEELSSIKSSNLTSEVSETSKHPKSYQKLYFSSKLNPLAK
jgi:hypothetical protein